MRCLIWWRLNQRPVQQGCDLVFRKVAGALGLLPRLRDYRRTQVAVAAAGKFYRQAAERGRRGPLTSIRNA
jgi:hypothetical protein